MADFTIEIESIGAPIAAVTILLAALGLLTAERYFDIGEDMLNKAEDVARRIDAIEEELFTCFCDVQIPQHTLVMNGVYDWTVPDVDPATVGTQVGSKFSSFCPAVERGENAFLERYNCTTAWHGCDHSIDIYCSESDVFVSSWYVTGLYRRQEFHERLKQAESTKVYQASQDDPGPIFRMLSNAQRGYQTMGLNALNAGDALVGLAGGALGFGLAGIFNG